MHELNLDAAVNTVHLRSMASTTDLVLGDSTQFARNVDLASRRARDETSRLRHHVARREPVANFLRNDCDDGDAGIILVALVDAIA